MLELYEDIFGFTVRVKPVLLRKGVNNEKNITAFRVFDSGIAYHCIIRCM